MLASMDEHTRVRAEELRQILLRANRLYYEEDAPELADAEYDRLLRELVELEAAHPELVTPESPTQRVGAPVGGPLGDVEHRVPMLSLANAFDADELRAFDARVRRVLGLAEDDPPPSYVAELKIDGLAISLRYEGGRFALGATRGDGRTGEDVTANLRTLEAIPERLAEPLTLEVRGEIYMPKAEFARINAEREEAGLPLYANPRNSGAGSLRQLDPQGHGWAQAVGLVLHPARGRRTGRREPVRGAGPARGAGLPGPARSRCRSRHRRGHRLHRTLA